jgi:Ribosomal protein L9, C-terminal domain
VPHTYEWGQGEIRAEARDWRGPETPRQLARRGIKVDRHKVDLPDSLKALGTYKVAIKVYPGMTPEVTIVVEPKG